MNRMGRVLTEGSAHFYFGIKKTLKAVIARSH